jgi:hypothetical protein
VSRVWKGPLRRSLAIDTGVAEWDCGFPFELQSDYVIYAVWLRDEWMTEPVLHTNVCLRTRVFDVSEVAPFGPGLDPRALVGSLILPWVSMPGDEAGR